MTDFLWLLVAYENLDQVDDCIDGLRLLPGSERFAYAVCDNSLVHRGSRQTDRRVVVVHRPDNPGYLEGALIAREAFLALHDGPQPAWQAISNTDIEVRSGDLLTALADLDPDSGCIIAPRITEGRDAYERNPHLSSRRPLWRLRVNALLAGTPLTTMAYQAASWLRRKSSHLRIHRDGRHDSTTWATNYPSGTCIYSPFGAMIIISRGFFSTGAFPRHVPLLAEEYAIAEAAAARGAPIIYRPEIHLHHSAHITTGPQISLARARRTSLAFRLINRHAGKRWRRGPD